MKHLARVTLATGVALIAASCGEPPSDGSLPAGPRMVLDATGGLDIRHFGYIADVRYEATVSPGDLRDSDTIEAAMAPADAVILAEFALSAVGEDPDEFLECGVDLAQHPHRSSYYYLVAFCRAEKPRSLGFRVPVLLSGAIIQPVVSEDQS